MDSSDRYLNPSALGTKEYWDATYARDLTNHATSTADEGTVWFSDADAETRVLSFLERLDDEARLRKGDLAEAEAKMMSPSSFLDLGTGNGHMLFALRAAGWAGALVGLDYSEASVALCEEILAARRERRRRQRNESAAAESGAGGAEGGDGGFDVVLDKGTFDAISLSDDVVPGTGGRRACEVYREKVVPLVKAGGGLLLVTSCNWTEEELRGWIEGAGEGGESGGFVFEDRIEYPRFRYGGKEGQSVVSVCFRRTGSG
ncbi:hypothetical protein BDY21DRAFT_288602 [Lineolata rhizophorae]|uniref:Protein-lysine N-methyltransferase EFM4 n=1 Tax=Lineolata rhizophorae TaxID=578093 RepID=A0A6A6NVJ6_9PEZI|nr:hypothetical protein BDY21DRAFT_288602 [Lineolata rhizophorae]